MTIKLAQYNIGNDQKYLQLCRLSKQINGKYCQINHYNYQFDFFNKDIITQLYGKFCWEYACVYRLQYIYDILMKDDCDYLVSLDADAVVSNPNIKIEDIIDDQHQLFLSRGNERLYLKYSIFDLYNKLGNLTKNVSIIETKDYNELMKEYDLFSHCERLSLGWIFHNEGLFIIKNTPLMKQFFKDCVDLIRFFIYRTVFRGRAYDRLIMDFVLLQQQYNDKWTFLYNQAQGGLANSGDTHYDVQKTFVLHNYGDALNIDRKIEQFNKIKFNKWWTELYK